MMKPQSIGALFKAAREKKGLSIEKIHQDTKMLPRIITAMEEDAFDKIGAKAYQESFLKKYARYLGLDASEEIASALKESAAQANSITAGILNKKVAAEEAPPRWIVPAVVMTASIAAVVFLAVVLLGRISHTEHGKGKRVQATAKTASEAKPISFGSKDERLRLALYAKEDVWVKVRSDGKVISQGVLTKGSKEMLEANSRFNIWTGKVEALSFSVNNRQLDIKGKGVVKDIRITHDGIEMRR